MAALLACPRKHYWRYEVGLGAAVSAGALRFGSAWHAAMECRWQGMACDAALEKACGGAESFTELDVATLSGLLAGYYARYGGEAEVVRTLHPEQAIVEAGGGAGYDAVILATGNRQACRDALGFLRARGRLVIFSAIPGETPMDLFRVHVKELEIVGACNDQDRLDSAVSALGDPGFAFHELITHRLPLERFREAVALAQSGRESAMKVAFTFEETR
jgi:Zn-dependent alcohol dehydrogenase